MHEMINELENDNYQQSISWLRDCYFQTQSRQINVVAGTRVLEQGAYNDRLYWVESGYLIAYFYDKKKDFTVEFFHASSGTFFGLHSFFSRNAISSTTIIAQTDCILSWIDLSTEPIEPQKYGSLYHQFMPVIIYELASRQMFAATQAIERTKAVEQLAASEHMRVLGELAAGVAHELNNAIGVINSKNESIKNALIQTISQNNFEQLPFFNLGMEKGQTITSSDVRKRSRELSEAYKIDLNDAKLLARAMPKGEITEEWLINLSEAIRYWDIGRDLYDMNLATKHAASIIRSVKQLGVGNRERYPDIDVNDTINKAIALLQGNLRTINVVLRPAVLPLIVASPTELVQIWVNIIKNAADAMQETRSPQLEITTRVNKGYLNVMISNNGPMIEESVRRKIFLPSFTTKNTGLSFGLGLGLAIVQRIVHDYKGAITVKSDQAQTTFRVKIPL